MVIIQIMDKDHGHQELMSVQKKDLIKTLDSIEPLKKGRMFIQAKYSDGRQDEALTKNQAVQQYDVIDRLLLRPIVTGG